MSISFLTRVVEDIQKNNPESGELVFVLPNKKSLYSLKSLYSKKLGAYAFAPSYHTALEFASSISSLKPAAHAQLLLQLYKAYLACQPKEKQSFDDFLFWGPILLADFNEIDINLAPVKKTLTQLSDIQSLNYWSPENGDGNSNREALEVWQNVLPIYQHYTKRQLDSKTASTGLTYRHASLKIKSYLKDHSKKSFFFIGFNALSKAEEKIIQQLLQHNQSEIYWDTDTVFINNQDHEAGYFMRKYFATWEYYKNNDIKWISDGFSHTKEIEIIGVPRNIDQAHYTGKILSEIKSLPGFPLSTAVIAGKAQIISSLLNTASSFEIKCHPSYGFNMSSTTLGIFFKLLFDLHIQKNSRGWFHRSVFALLNHPIAHLSSLKNSNQIEKLKAYIASNNALYVSQEIIQNHIESMPVGMFFTSISDGLDFSNLIIKFLNQLNIIIKNKEKFYPQLNIISQFQNLFVNLKQVIVGSPFINNLKTYYSFYNTLIKQESLFLTPGTTEGLHISSMLESRNLDFETVIITSVNEGSLPNTQKEPSFLSFEIRKDQGLPLFKEKDAIYAYNFYRLFLRARKIFLLHTTETEVIQGGEKSRYLLQLLAFPLKNHKITVKQAAPKVLVQKPGLLKIGKTPDILVKLKSISQNGFSPTALMDYVLNPLHFYTRYILGVDEITEVEESLQLKSMGTAAHNTLETLYKPYEGTFLIGTAIKNMLENVEETLKKEFLKIYTFTDKLEGKNLLMFTASLEYLRRFLRFEEGAVRNGNKIKLLAVEKKLRARIEIPELGFPVFLKGKIDRIEEYNGALRVIDYKTGKVLNSSMEITSWESLADDYKYSKALQVLSYAWLYKQDNPEKTASYSGVYSFKNINAGFISFAQKASSHSRKKNHLITDDVLANYVRVLKMIILEICDPEIPFTQRINEYEQKAYMV